MLLPDELLIKREQESHPVAVAIEFPFGIGGIDHCIQFLMSFGQCRGHVNGS